MKIAIDIDNVIVNTTQRVIDYINERMGFQLKLEDIKSYWIEDSLPEQYRWIVPHAFEDKEMWKGIELIEGAVKTIEELYLNNHEIYFATATTAENFRKKVKYLTRVMPFFPEDYVRKHSISIKVKQLLNVDILIDDCTDNFTGDRPYAAICLNYPWNDDFLDKAGRKGDWSVNSWDGIWCAIRKIEDWKNKEEKDGEKTMEHTVNPITFIHNGVVYTEAVHVAEAYEEAKSQQDANDLIEDIRVYLSSCFERIVKTPESEETYIDLDFLNELIIEMHVLDERDYYADKILIDCDLDEQRIEYAYIFKNPYDEDKFYKLTVNYNDYYGYDYNILDIKRVKPQEKTITVFTDVTSEEKEKLDRTIKLTF